MIQDIFVIDGKNENPCVFYGQIEQSPQPPNLAEILSMLIQKSSALAEKKSDTLQTSQGKYLFGNFGKILVILKIAPTADDAFVAKYLNLAAERFLSKYEKDLESYEGDVSVFANFGEVAAETYSEIQQSKPAKPATPSLEIPSVPQAKSPLPSKESSAELKVPSIKAESAAGADLGKPSPIKASDFMRTPEPIKFTPQPLPSKQATAQVIKPMKREAYPDGIPEYSRDEILWNESQSVMQEYSADFVEDSVSKLSLNLSISLTHHYSMEIDFTTYPERPIITVSKGLEEELKEPITEALTFLKGWDPKMPPHIIEIVRELEGYLTRMKSQGKLSATDEMPETALPDLVPLKPLPKLTPEEEVRIKKWEAEKKAIKQAEAEKEAKEAKAAPAGHPTTATPQGSAKPAGQKVAPIDKKEQKHSEKEKKEQKHSEKEKKEQKLQKIPAPEQTEQGCVDWITSAIKKQGISIDAARIQTFLTSFKERANRLPNEKEMKTVVEEFVKQSKLEKKQKEKEEKQKDKEKPEKSKEKPEKDKGKSEKKGEKAEEEKEDE